MDGVKIPVWVIIVLCVLFVASIIGVIRSYLKAKSLEEIRADVYQLFLKAERKFKESNAGKQKMKWVIQQARMLLPGWVQTFATEEALEKVLETWFRSIKDLLDDGKVNGSQNE